MPLYRERNSLEVIGLDELQKMFKDLPKELSDDKIWNEFWKENTKPLVDAAKQKADAISAKSSNGTGQLGNSIGFFRTNASKKYKGGYVGPRVKGRFAKKTEGYKGSNKKKMYSKSGFYGAWIEYGREVKFGGRGFGKKSQPFMSPAYEQTKNVMIAKSLQSGGVVMSKLIKRHEKRLQKYGRFGY